MRMPFGGSQEEVASELVPRMSLPSQLGAGSRDIEVSKVSSLKMPVGLQQSLLVRE